MTKKLAVVMDAIESINYKKDSTLAMLWEAAKRHYEIYYLTPDALFLENNTVYANSRLLTVYQTPDHYYDYQPATVIPLAEMDVVLMRKDPPFDMTYIYTTYLLELAEQQGAIIINKPQSLRDANEKLFTAYFKDCVIDTLVSCQAEQIHSFIHKHQDVVLKPLGTMGGESIFRIKAYDVNTNVMIETLTKNGKEFVMAQRFIPEVTYGDKRILLIDGEPIPYALARIPSANDFRGNLARGAKGVVQPLSERDYDICRQIGPTLKAKGLIFVGIDVIGDYITEINVTSPTCIREIEADSDAKITKTLFDAIENRIV